MNKSDMLLFYVVGLITHLEKKGIIHNSEFMDYLTGLLDDNFFNLSEEHIDELRKSIDIFLPIRAVK